MQRREFITLLGGAAAAWALGGRAQQNTLPLIGVLIKRAPDDPDGQARIVAFRQALQTHGLLVDRDVRLEVRWGADIVELERKYAAELMALSPNVILAGGTLGVSAVQSISRTVPIVFAAVTDPVGA